MSEDSRKVIEPLLTLAAPQRRRFLKQLLVGSSALACLALPETKLLAQEPPDDRGRGRGKGKGKGKGDGGGDDRGRGRGKGRGKGDGDGRGRGKGKGKG